MKKILLSMSGTLLALLGLGQLNEFQTGYQLSLPQSYMKHGWKSGNGMHCSYYRHFKNLDWLSVGGQLGFGSYATSSQPQQYRFADGTITNTTANLTSYLGNFSLAARVSPLASKKVSPFFELQAGYFTMSSNLYIADPNDPGGCRALESRTIVQSGTAFWSPGAGVQIFLGRSKQNEIHSLELAARHIRGNQLEYANMNRLYHEHGQTNNQEPTLQNGESPLLITFINVTTNELHQHSVAELYKHPLRVMQYSVSYSYRFGKSN